MHGILSQTTATTVILPPPIDDEGNVITDLTGLTVYVAKDGGASAARESTGTVTQDSNTNDLRVPIDQGDTDTLGDLVVHATGLANQQPCWRTFTVVAVPVRAALVNGDPGELEFEADVTKWQGTTLSQGLTDGAPLMSLHSMGQSGIDSTRFAVYDDSSATPLDTDDNGRVRLQRELHIAASVATTDTASSFTASADLEDTADAYVDMIVVFTSGANAGVPRRITGYTSGRVVTVDSDFPFTIAENDEFVVIGYTG